MVSRRIAHLSDLHIGAASEEASEWLVQAVLRSGAERVAITGDVTHRGRAAELERFRRAFAPPPPPTSLAGGGRPRAARLLPVVAQCGRAASLPGAVAARAAPLRSRAERAP